MNRIAKRAKILVVLIILFLLFSAIFIRDYYKAAGVWVTHPSNQNIYNEGVLAVDTSIYSKDGILLLHSSQEGLEYADDAIIRESTLHVVGDGEDNITAGLLSSQKERLIGYDVLNGVFRTSQNQTITTTIDTELSRTAYEALGGYNGAVGVYNYKTGEIITMVSKPTYDPYNVPDLTLEQYDGVYINRVMNGLYVPGSIMKLVTSYAALETIPDIQNQTFHCEHGVEIDGQWIECTGYHGDQTFQEALTNSCNAAYADISLQLGDGVLESYMQKAGITTNSTISGATTSEGVFTLDGATNADTAWAGIGQYKTLVNPMQFLEFVGAIANEGTLVHPYFAEDASFLSKVKNEIARDSTELIDTNTAMTLKTMMRNNTINNYGDYNFPELDLGAKSGTAEIEDGNPHSWFVGFSSNPDVPLAFVVIVENGANTNTTAINVSMQVMGKAKELYQP